MSSIDERVISMKFDNAQFEQGIKTTLASLDALNKGLKLENATKGLSDLDAAGKAVNLGHIASGVEDIANRFKAMSVIAITALSTIAHQAITSGTTLVKSLTIDPIKSGLEEYQTNLNSIQTILSNTQWQNTGLNDVNKALAILNEYSDKTIYSFSEMARNIGTFTAAGVKLQVAVDAIKGISNLAAISGSNSQQAATAMYQLSQAISTGTVKLIDWNSVVNAGMGGKVFQDALMETARVHGVAIDSMLKQAGSFRNTLEKGWLTSTILTETLSKFTGDLSAQQLKAMGYNDKQIAGILKMGQTAQDAATKVKTVSALIGTLQESAGSGWAETWQLIFGDFEEAKALFTDVNDVLGGFIKSSADARNEVLGDWKELGGRTVLIEAISLAFNDLMEILFPIKLAFRDIFPAKTGQQLYDITVAIRDFFSAARHGEDTMTNIRRTFAGVFAVLGIGYDVIKQVARVLFELFQGTGDGAHDFLEVTANIGDFLVGLRKAINEGQGLVKFFDGVRDVIAVPLKMLSNLAHILSTLFEDIDTEQAAGQVGNFVKSFGPLGPLADFVAYTWDHILAIFGKAWDVFEPLASKFADWFHSINDAVGGLNFESLLHAINTGAFVGLVVLLKRGLGKGGISGVLNELTSTLSAVQTTLHATTLLEIALAIGVLAVSINVLSKIDAQALGYALGAISVMFVQLIGALAVLNQIPGNSVARLYVMAAAMTVLAIAIDLLTVAVKVLADIDAKDLHKGLIGVMILLGSIVAAARLMPDGAALTSTAIGLLIISAAIKILASAVTDLSGLSWEEMAKGLTGVGALLLALGLFGKFASTNATGVLSGIGIILLATGIKILASALTDISGLDWIEISKGLTVLAASLVAIGAAMLVIPPTAPLQAAGVAIVAGALLILAEAFKSMEGLSWETIGKGMVVMAASLYAIILALDTIPPTAPLQAAGVAIVAAALLVLAQAMKQMGGMSWEQIAKGLVVLGGALAIIALALSFMTTALPGALALIVVAGALAILTPVLMALGSMEWGEIIKGLVTLAGVFLVLGLAGAVLTPVIPTLLGLGLAIALIGGGLALAGAGVFLFAAGLTALSIAGAAGAAAIVAIVSAVIGLIPMIVQQVGVALLVLIKVIADAAPMIVALTLDILVQILEGIVRLAPVIGEALLKLIIMLLDILVTAIPKMVEAGYKIIIGILQGIRDNIGKTITTAGQVIAAFLKGIGDALPGVVQAGVDLIIKFIDTLGIAINNNSERLGKAGVELAMNIVKGTIKGLNGAVKAVVNAAVDLARSALDAVGDFLGISSPSKEFMKIGRYSAEGMAVGIDKHAGIVADSSEAMGNGALIALRKSIAEMANLVRDDMNLSPTITPVLDLTDVQKNVGHIGNLLKPPPLSMDATYASARQADNWFQLNKKTADENDMAEASSITYIQNNNSPKALSPAEIYRQTKNQLSTVKGGLTK